MSSKIAVVLVRGLIGMRPEFRETLKRLKLSRKNNCVGLENKQELIGMVTKVKDFVTWGPITAETDAKLAKKMIEGVARLNPPRKGFGRKGIKKPFTMGGALGNRGEKMDDLVMRMIYDGR